jgi:predicted small lipoprotein YifL
MRRSPAGTLALLVLAFAVAACGKKGPMRSPEPRGPTPPKEVVARQTGLAVDVSFVVPSPRGPKPSQQPVRAELVRIAFPPGLRPPQEADAFRRLGVVVTAITADPMKAGSRLRLQDPSWRDLAGRGVDWTLRYGVRVRDRRGRPSPLVVAPDLIPVEPPPAPTGLVAEATGDGIRVKWAPARVEGSAKYNLYRADQNGSFGERPVNREPLPSAEYLDTETVAGRTYRYRVRTAASDGPPYRESASSEEVAVLAEDRFPPQPPTGLVAVQEGKAIRLFWSPNPERDLAGYHVYRRYGSGEWTRVDAVLDPEPLLLDSGVQAGTHVSYRVTAVDRAGNESGVSETVELDAVADTGDARESGR